MSRAGALALSLALGCSPPAAGPVVISPEQGAPVPEEERDRSRGGRERGVIEFALAGVTAATAATLVTLGAVQLYRGREIRAYCEGPPEEVDFSVCQTPTGDPSVNAAVSASLSFFFAAPMATASGFLLRRGLRIQRDYRRWQAAQVSAAPWAGPRGAGLGVRLRF